MGAAGGAQLPPKGCAQHGGTAHTHRVDHVPPGGAVHGCSGAQQAVVERLQVTLTGHMLQKVSGEDAAIHALGDGYLGQCLPTPQQAFYHQFGRFAAQRNYLQVEIALPQAHFVQRSKLKDHFFVDAQWPALVVQHQAFEAQLGKKIHKDYGHLKAFQIKHAVFPLRQM